MSLLSINHINILVMKNVLNLLNYIVNTIS